MTVAKVKIHTDWVREFVIVMFLAFGMYMYFAYSAATAGTGNESLCRSVVLQAFHSSDAWSITRCIESLDRASLDTARPDLIRLGVLSCFFLIAALTVRMILLAFSRLAKIQRIRKYLLCASTGWLIACLLYVSFSHISSSHLCTVISSAFPPATIHTDCLPSSATNNGFYGLMRPSRNDMALVILCFGVAMVGTCYRRIQ